ncbi:MAG: hypothetical protein JXB13_02560 [Phycisphaerae bacterium]|nr:hypothetical protein [Phycisphaerae bacterium]
MKMRAVGVVTVLVSLPWPAFAQSKAAEPAPRPAETKLAPSSCAVRIACDASALHLSEGGARELFNVALERTYPDFRVEDSSCSASELRAALRLSRVDARDGAMFGGEGGMGGGGMGMMPSGPPPASGAMICILSAEWEEAACEPVRQGFWEALCGRVDAMLKEASQQEWQRRERGLAVAEQQLDEMSSRLQQLAELEQGLRSQAGVEDLRLDRVLKMQGSLRERLADMERELKRTEAQENAILQQIARVDEQAQSGPDPIAEEVEKIVAAHQEKVDHTRALVKSGHASDTKLLQAEAELAEARVRLLQQRTERRAQAGGLVVGRLRERLAEVAIRAQEIRAESEFLRQELEGMKSRNVTAIAAEYERQIGFAPENLRSRMRELQQQVDALRADLAARQTPSVTILGGS